MTPNTAVVIPSIKDEIRTLESIPEDVPVTVEKTGTLNEARNHGVRETDADVIVIMDDDIAFSEELFYSLIDRVDQDTLLGVKDWEFGLVAGRVMVFHRKLWEDVGGFDEQLRSHNGDTDFSIKAHRAGYDVLTVPRSLFDHEEHERSITTWDRVWRLGYLCTKHPRYVPLLLSNTVAYNIRLATGIKPDRIHPHK
ncbi:glycosyltransferase family 2 protein [Halomicrococcus sp. SG-WS-1]|uniref:glycosyltransferase family 2 protein n=1 Tax=Halomicrococcus sp. SG-WS-1 TaxID=3439057 RepID=UPI003F78E065